MIKSIDEHMKIHRSIEINDFSVFNRILQKYSIKDGKIIYSDASMDFQMIIDGLDHTGKGDFTQDVFDLKTQSHAQAPTLSYGGDAWIDGPDTDLDADVTIDKDQEQYSFSY